ncbi:unnamed protein product [Schistocephalus solidus]|uniref:Gamma-tubulin complex component n=1 Tax=Schistocephalus solidus TaxID=70667 RepID=A0A183T9S9_SCHSO|nr:unnamed protein product [Schistocephalus solidus]
MASMDSESGAGLHAEGNIAGSAVRNRPTQFHIPSVTCGPSEQSPDNCFSFFGAFKSYASSVADISGLYSKANPLLWLPDDEQFQPFQEFRLPQTITASSTSLVPSESLSSHGLSTKKMLSSGSSAPKNVWESADFHCHLKTGSYIDPFILDAIRGLIPGLTTKDLAANDWSSSLAIVPTWEKRGCPDVTIEKPFLSESGAMATHNLLCAYRLRYPAAVLPPGRQEASRGLDQPATPERLFTIRRAFFRDLFNALVGQASPRFQWDPDPVASFFWHQEGTADRDSLAFHISVGCLRSCLAPHLIAATAYRRLDNIVRTNMSRVPLLGYVNTALMHALSQWLRSFAVAMAIMSRAVSSPTTADLYSLSQRLSPLVSSLLLVAEVCGVLLNGSPNPKEHTQPAILRLRGVRLLSYLAAWIDLSTHCDSGRSAIRHLFRRACAPFLQFLQKWVLEGRCDDPFYEFSIIINHRFDDHTDISFWKHFVSLRSPSPDQSEEGLAALRRPHLTEHTSAFYGLLPPSFENSVLRCGLSLTLLRKIDPNHFIFNQCSVFPQIGLWNNAEGWDALQSRLAAYEQGVKSASDQARTAWFQALIEEEKERRRVLAQVVSLTNAAIARDEAKTLTELETGLQERRVQLSAEEENIKLADRRFLEEAQRRDFTEPRVSQHTLKEERHKVSVDTRDIYIATQIRVYRACVRFVLLYGCECWAIRVEDEQKLEVFDHHCLKTILRPSKDDDWWFGHVLRGPLQELSVTAIDPAPLPNWRRRRGGQLKIWLDTVCRDMEVVLGLLVFGVRRWLGEWIELHRENLNQEYMARTLEVDQRKEPVELACVKRSPLTAAHTNIANTDAHSITVAASALPKPPLSLQTVKSPASFSRSPSRLESPPPPACDKQTATTVTSSEELISEVDLLSELRQQFRLRNTRGRPPRDRIRDIIQPGVTMQWKPDTTEGNKENNAQLQESSSARDVNSQRLSSAKRVLYGPGLGPTCRLNTWRKPGNVEHLPDEEILAFSNELLEPPPPPPPYLPLENCEIDFGWFFCLILALLCSVKATCLGSDLIYHRNCFAPRLSPF